MRKTRLPPHIRHFIKTYQKNILIGVFLFFATILVFLSILNDDLLKKYNGLESVVVKDRNGEIVSVQQNAKGQYARYTDTLPQRTQELLLKKEDRFFYFHLGINPLSIARATFRYLFRGSAGGSSTITQQLVKNLLSNERDRSWLNKFEELIGTLAIETFQSKKEILTMYSNTVFMGNGIQGLSGASEDYFGKELSDLSDTEITMILATLSSPTATNPWKSSNISSATLLAKRLNVDFKPSEVTLAKKSDSRTEEIATDTNFELNSLGDPCAKTCTTTLDKKLTDSLRVILKRTIDESQDLDMNNGSIVVIKEPENQLLAVVGTPIVGGTDSGHAINMAIQPRPIGSTAKPFIYLNAFEKGLRPYTLVNDREYKFSIGNGMPFYPKNYDGLYRGWVTLHYALSNSLNIPTVKTLEYVSLPDFYYFLEHRLAFKPLQDLDSYQYGIALGGLEMDPLTLTYNMTLFPNNGVLKPLQLYFDNGSAKNYIQPPMSQLSTEEKIADPKYVELVTRILNDRKTGVEQFGLQSNLNLSQDNYAVKTGTSRDYHDSWTIGYTPDFVVAVWVGNAENTPLQHVTGQSGAGRIWNESMELLFNSEYNKKTPFDFSNTKEVDIGNSLDFALIDDVVAEHRNLLEDKSLIVAPHDSDIIQLEATTIIPLVSREEADWYEGDQLLGHGQKVYFTPPHAGNYRIKATSKNTSETIMLTIE